MIRISSVDIVIAWLRSDLPPLVAEHGRREPGGLVSAMRMRKVRIDAARNSQLACFSSLMKSAILPPRKLPKDKPASKTPMTLVQP